MQVCPSKDLQWKIKSAIIGNYKENKNKDYNTLNPKDYYLVVFCGSNAWKQLSQGFLW